VTPNSVAICVTVCARLPLLSVSSYSSWARSTWRGVESGFLAAGAATGAGGGESGDGAFGHEQATPNPASQLAPGTDP